MPTAPPYIVIDTELVHRPPRSTAHYAHRYGKEEHRHAVRLGIRVEVLILWLTPSWHLIVVAPRPIFLVESRLHGFHPPTMITHKVHHRAYGGAGAQGRMSCKQVLMGKSLSVTLLANVPDDNRFRKIKIVGIRTSVTESDVLYCVRNTYVSITTMIA